MDACVTLHVMLLLQSLEVHQKKKSWMDCGEGERKKSKVGWGPPKLAPITTSFGGVSFLGGVTTN
jgi:hypothetical protein